MGADQSVAVSRVVFQEKYHDQQGLTGGQDNIPSRYCYVQALQALKAGPGIAD
jgi:hypothetical protein